MSEGIAEPFTIAPDGSTNSRTWWDRDRLIAACQAYNDRHGRPPTAAAWGFAAVEHPTHETPRRLFGSWNAFLEASGFEARDPFPHQRRVDFR